jgi:hypothetical protein
MTAYHARYSARELTRKRPAVDVDRLSMSLFNAAVDLRLAREFGLSDVRLAKLCRRHDIHVAGRVLRDELQFAYQFSRVREDRSRYTRVQNPVSDSNWLPLELGASCNVVIRRELGIESLGSTPTRFCQLIVQNVGVFR